MTAQLPRVAVTVVTYNSGKYIRQCLESALALEYSGYSIYVVDNASSDETLQVLAEFGSRVHIQRNGFNAGFAGGHNQAMQAAAGADWFLTLNPDVRLRPDFLNQLMTAARKCGSADLGSLCPKLLAVSPDFTEFSPPLIDSAGIYFTPNLRHLDRGNREVDSGQYEKPEWVVGGTGAACLYRREMIADISFEGEFFDNDFFAYREDADVAWRAQLLGWRCLYVPQAVGWHVRTVTPEARGSLSSAINMHSVKNRWLLRIKNATRSLYARFWWPVTVRDIVVIGGCLLREWSSLPAFLRVVKLWRKTWHKRQAIMLRRKAFDEDRWFAYRPVSFPASCE